jgi:hypothetical protein
MSAEPDTGTELPKGRKCSDCLWVKECEYKELTRRENDYCKFSPSRFFPRRKFQTICMVSRE